MKFNLNIFQFSRRFVKINNSFVRLASLLNIAKVCNFGIF